MLTLDSHWRITLLVGLRRATPVAGNRGDARGIGEDELSLRTIAVKADAP